MLAAVQGVVGTWVVTVLAVNPFAKIKSYLFLTNVHFSYFFVIWFRPRARVRWVMPMISEFLLGYFRTVLLGLIYNDVSPFWVLPGFGLCPPSLCISFLF